MKASGVFRSKGYWSVLLLSLLFLGSTFAQSDNIQCPGVNALITNGSILNLCEGSTVTLNAQTNTAYSFYQWQRQTTAGGAFINIASANSSSYSTNMLAAYRVIVGNGTCTDTSSILTIVSIPIAGGTITSTAPAAVCNGASGGILSGAPVAGDELGIITYQWEKREGNGAFVAIPAATGTSYTAGAITTVTSYRRMAKNNCNATAYSNTITITPYTVLLSGSIQPATQTITSGSTPALLTSAAGATQGSGSYTYQWQSAPADNGPWTNIAGATGTTYQPGAQLYTTYYRRIAKDVNCPNEAVSNGAEVIVSNPGALNPGLIASENSCLFIGNTPLPITTKLTPVGGTPPYTIQWEQRVAGGAYTLIAGASGATYQPVPITQSTEYRKKVTDAAGTIRYTDPIMLNVIATPLNGGTIIPGSALACIGSSPAIINGGASASGYGEKIYYQWQMKTGTGAWTNITGAQREYYQPDPLTVKTMFRRATVDACGTNTRTAYSNEVEIDTRPALLAGDIRPSTQLITAGQTPALLTDFQSPSGGTNAYTLSWERSGIATGPWSVITGASALTYQPGATNQSTYFRRVVKDNNCLAVKYTFIVEVSVVNVAPLTGGKLVGSICVFPGNRPATIESTNPPITGGMTPYTFQWENRVGTTGTFSVITGATSLSYQPPVITQTMQYRRRVTDALGTTAYSDTFTMNYVTTPLNPGTINYPGNAFVCSGSAPGQIVSTQTASGFLEAAMYQWQMKTEGGAWINITGANRDYYTPAAITQKTYFRRAVSDKCSGVTRTTYSNEVVLDIVRVTNFRYGLVDGPFITCTGSAPGTIKSVLDACGGGGTLRYQWEVNTGNGWSNITGATGASYTPGAINVNTTYRRRVTDDCGNGGYSNEVMIFVYPAIEAGVIGTETQTVCANQMPSKIKLMTNCHYTDGTVTYQWQSATSMAGPYTDIAGATTNEYQPGMTGVNMYYKLKVMSTTCSAIVYTNVASVLRDVNCRAANPGNVANKSITIYPNPTSGNFVMVAVETKGNVTARLQSMLGESIACSITKSDDHTLKITIPNRISKGTYVLQIFDGQNRWSEKVIIQ